MNDTNASTNLKFDEANARITELMCGRVVCDVYRNGLELVFALKNGHHITIETNDRYDICFKKLKVDFILNSVTDCNTSSHTAELNNLLRGQIVDCVMRQGKNLIIVCKNGCQVTIASNVNHHILYKSHETKVYLAGVGMGAKQGAIK